MQWRWWHVYGQFPPDEDAHDFPDPKAVIAYFQEKNNVSWQLLADILGTKEGAARYVVRDGIKLNRVSCRRNLSQALTIPPRLLGLDEERPANWWRQLGYSFDAWPDGYPLLEQVMKYFRERTIKQFPDGTKKHWTQQDLAEAFENKVTRRTIIAMETTGKGLDFINRRRALAQLLQIAPAALFGLASISSLAQSVSTVGNIPQQMLAKEQIYQLLSGYQQEAKSFYNDYYQMHGQNSLQQALERIHTLQYLETVSTKEMGVKLKQNIAHYRKFVILVAREQQNYPLLFSHADASVAYAKEREVADNIALALLLRAESRREQGNLSRAIKDIEEARSYAKNGSSFSQCRVLIEAAVIYAQAAQDQTDKMYAIKLLDAASRFDGWLEIGNKDFTKFDHGFYHLRRVMAFTACKEMTHIRDELYMARQRIAMPRRLVTLDIYEAQYHLRLGQFDEATSLSLDALQESKSLQSYVNRARIETLHNALSTTSYGGYPDVARLGLMLRNWQ